MTQERPRRRPRTRTSERRAYERALRRTLQHGTAAIYEDALFFEHFYRRRSADVRMYVELARRYGGPVLELGVGTGRVALAIARAGIEVVGVEPMQSMLARARERAATLPAAARERIELRRGDMRKLALGRRFALVIAPFNAFMHLYSRRDVEAALACCARHLRPAGRLAFDVALPDLRALVLDPERIYRGPDQRDPRDGARLRYHEASHYDVESQIRSVTMLLEQSDAPFARRVVPLTHRQFFPAELEALLHYNGFRIEARYGDFAFGPLRAGSETQVLVARPLRARKQRLPR